MSLHYQWDSFTICNTNIRNKSRQCLAAEHMYMLRFAIFAFIAQRSYQQRALRPSRLVPGSVRYSTLRPPLPATVTACSLEFLQRLSQPELSAHVYTVLLFTKNDS